MRKVTKRPKKVEVIEGEVTYKTYTYICPTCRTHIRASHLPSEVIRFRCIHCSQVLEVTSRKEAS